MASVPFRSLIGCALWVYVVSRPDIGPALLHLCRFQNNPGRAHWDALLWLLGYLLDTRSLKLTLGGIDHTGFRLLCYCDSNYEKSGNCKSVSGYIITIGGFGSICWSSKQQTLTALSSTEAEYVALTPAVKQVLWLRMMLTELSIAANPHGVATIVYCDNSAAIAISKHDIAFGRTKHIDIRHHFIRDYILLRSIQVC
jgi:hypothetical protein